ncbi:MAG: ABC transporter ATP-binding protein [Spirochaetaceae bacterium]|jgi:iron complex transport system ATP-binding protein|nr:ABC transporter ATP-binding protein [Spirochaetaceae bacterium]
MTLEVRHLNFAQGNHRILQDISFSLETGRFFALLGPNGAGKSTLFRCLLGLERPESGEVLLNRERIEKKSPQELARQIAYIPQIHYPTFNYTVLDMVLMGTAAQGREWSAPNNTQRQAAEEALERLGLGPLRRRGFRHLSGGEQQLILIARALAQKAALLILDEPTANLDYGNQLRVLLQVKELNKEGYSILLSTHNPDHAFLFADRVLALHDTRLAAEGPPPEVLTPKLIATLYGIQVEIHQKDQGLPHCVPVLPGASIRR